MSSEMPFSCCYVKLCLLFSDPFTPFKQFSCLFGEQTAGSYRWSLFLDCAL